MVKLEALDDAKRFAIIDFFEKNIGSLVNGCETLTKDYYCRRIKEIIQTHYNVGEVKEIYEIFGGTVNKNYAVRLRDGKLWFLRQYVQDKEEKEILYEHALLKHIRENGFTLNSLPMETRNGSTFFRETVGEQASYFSLSEFLEGEDKYQWERNEVTPEACASAARTEAQFHMAAYDFDPLPGWGNNEPVIREQLAYYAPHIREYAAKIAKDPGNLLFSNYLHSKLTYIDEVTKRLQKIFTHEDAFVKTVIHTDLHPGNFKYKDENVVAMFDFDWPKKDVRLYETAISAMFFTSSWGNENNGEIDVDLMKLFINTYNDALKKAGGMPGPLTKTEMQYFPEMMMIGSMYVVHFCIGKCAEVPGTNIFEYYYYTLHQLQCVEWIDGHLEELRRICLSL